MSIGRRLAAAAALIVVPVLLTSCSEDAEPYQASIGTNERTESTDALGFAIVVDGEGNGRVVGTLVNTSDQPQTLVGAEVESERGQVRAVVDEDLPLPPNEPVELARDAAIAVSAADLPEGLFVELTLTIDGALEPIEMLVPVEPQDGPYAEIEVPEATDGDVSP